MPAPRALLAFAALAFALPGTASAADRFDFGRARGGRAAPVRAPEPRAPAPAASRSTPFFRPSAPAPRTQAPRASAASPGRQAVLRSGHAPAPRIPEFEGRSGFRSPVRTASVARGPLLRDPAPAPGFREAAPRRALTGRSTAAATPFSTASGRTRSGGDGLLGRVADHLHGRDSFGHGGGGGGGGGGHVTPVDYNSGWRNGYRVGSRDGCRPYHRWYDDHGWNLTFSFGASCGPYYGVSYYRPFHSWVFGCDYAFFYPAPVTYCYVPFGFYGVATPYYVTRYEVVRETVPVTVYEERVTYTTGEIDARAPAGAPAPAASSDADVKVAEPVPAAGSPATEKFLREASDHFRKKEYYEAAVQFRLAALSSPDLPGPLFALGQALTAMEQDAYAAKVIRRAVEMGPKMLQETGDISGVWESPEEFDRVVKALEARAAASPVDGDARFLLAAERYFSGDVRCRETFDLLHEARPLDGAVDRFRAASAQRFKGPEDLPAIEKK